MDAQNGLESPYIRWKLCTGRLPNVDVPEIYAASGSGGYCDACDELLAPTQFVIAIPWSSEKTFAHLHARCYVLWNDELCVARLRTA